jgi:hypothetical protein
MDIGSLPTGILKDLMYLIFFQAQGIPVDVQILDDRLKELDARRLASLDSKREESCKREITGFMGRVSGQGIASCTPGDVRRFLVWKDQSGKSQVHRIDCQFLGSKGIFECGCPLRLASGTVSLLINRLLNVQSALVTAAFDIPANSTNGKNLVVTNLHSSNFA